MQAVALICSIVALAWAAATTPTSGRCAPGWHLATGIRQDGTFSCFAPLPECCGDSKGECELVPCPPHVEIRSRIYCTGGTVPIVVDHETVGCQRE